MRIDRISQRFDPWALALLVTITRVPFFARTLFEFDSVNYAVALFRYDLSQDTPHLPGYLLHVGIAKVLVAITRDANAAYVFESFLLSLGSVLLVWWCLQPCIRRGLAFGVAALWALNPIFWFYGCVASAYCHEAFFTAAFAALAIRYCLNADQQRTRAFFPIAMAVTIAVAGSARQTSVMFLMPALLVALWSVHAPLRIWIAAGAAGIVVSAIWVSMLLHLAGGWSSYLALMNTVTIVQYNSVFLHGTLTRHLDMIGKMLVYLIIGTAPYWTLCGLACIRRPHETAACIRNGLQTPAGSVLATMIVVPLAFYTLIFYAKPGYLLNIFTAATIASAILAERFAIAGIIRQTKWWMIGWGIAWGIYFLCPLPGKSIENIHRQEAIASTVFDASHRFPSIPEKIEALLTKIFSYASTTGISAFDEDNFSRIEMLDRLPSPPERQVIIAATWGQHALFYRPQSTVYDFALMPDKNIPTYLDHDMIKRELTDSIIALPTSTQAVVLFMWSQHWAFPAIQQQVHLEPIPMPKYLDAWKITDEHFRLKMGGVVIVR